MIRATGIVRRIDDLGRVVVPKEIRRILKIREGDPLEIFTDKENGQVCFRRYSPLGELGTLCKALANQVYNSTNLPCCVVTSNEIIAKKGNNTLPLNSTLSDEMIELIHERKIRQCNTPSVRI